MEPLLSKTSTTWIVGLLPTGVEVLLFATGAFVVVEQADLTCPEEEEENGLTELGLTQGFFPFPNLTCPSK